MSPQNIQYFGLIVPACMLLLGLTLQACWMVLREQRFLLWIAAGYFLPSVALAAQSLMDNAQLARWSMLAGTFYLMGSWALAHGMAKRQGGRAFGALALAIGVTCMAAMAYYTLVDEQLWIRTLWLNSSICLLYALGLPSVLRSPNAKDPFERALRWSYVSIVGLALLRPILVLNWVPGDQLERLTASRFWFLLLAITLLLGLWFMVVLLACTFRDVMRVFDDERNRDPLTRLSNRRRFFEAATRCLQMSRLQPWTILLCDIDHFKKINDRWGHAMGDKVLQQFAEVLESSVRSGDLVGRLGGDEFVLLLNRCDPESAQLVYQRVRKWLQEQPMLPAGQCITTSFGAAAIDSAHALPQAMEQADTALYRAKQAGRDCMHTMGDGLSATLRFTPSSPAPPIPLPPSAGWH
ncbi:GGDEF domain-containing protein [Corticibacter populi]|uniref:GGDEF domain-containing protein n=1 Tax=Corticibacter populi TaxID=1550736 RepID=UPI0010DCE94E|nr:GGDEF domain-containing protein [Corticibacter populi]RZS33442.1 diguanylate cyclase [Corticibacter populi]